MQEITRVETATPTDDAPESPDFSNLATNMGDNPHVLRPHPLKSHLNPPHSKSPPRVVECNPSKIAKYNLRPNPKPNADPDFRRLDSITSIQ